VTATALAKTSPAAGASSEFPHVLSGVILDGAAARLAGMLDRALLEEAGWDPAARILFLPAQHRLLGRQVCRAEGCTGTVHNDCPGVCYRCFTRLQQLGMSAAGIAAAGRLPAAPAPAGHCAVPECQCKPTVRQAVMCEPHAAQFRNRRTLIPLEQFLTDRWVRPLPPLRACLVLACTRSADGAIGYCNTHYQRWRVAGRGNAGVDEQWWQATEPGVAEPGQVNLRALPPLVVVEVLAGLQTRLRGGLRLTDVVLRAAGDTLRRQQALTIHECDPGLAPGKRARSVLRAFTRDVRRALADPGIEQGKDIWDLAIFGHPGALSFTKITQPWLAAAAKRWAAGQLPRHRGSGASRVQAKINNVGLLSQHLNGRPDQGGDPAALGRGDMESFLNRIAYLEANGQISRYRRNMICRDVRAVLAGIRALGLARAGQAAAGLAGDVAVGRAGIPADPQRGEPGRDLPTEIMTVVCANLHTLEPAEVRAATQIGIDTGRRPGDILSLPLDCLTRDKDGGAVLVYDQRQSRPAGPPPADQQRHRRGDHRPASPGPAAVPPWPGREAEAAAHHLPEPRREQADQQIDPGSPAPRLGQHHAGPVHPRRSRVRPSQDRALCLPAQLRPAARRCRCPHRCPGRTPRPPELFGDPRLLPDRRRPPPRRRRQGHHAHLRPARQPHLA
jgi:hypothetical protein